MKRSKSEEEAVEESGDVLPETKADAMDDYRNALKDLAASAEKLATLRQIESEVLAQAAKLEADREAALNLAAEADLEKALEGDVDAHIDLAGLTETSTKLEIARRKLSDLSGRLQALETELGASQSAVAARFSALWHGFFQHALERAKDALNEQLVPGVAEHIIELVARHTHAVVAVRKLDIRTIDARDVLERGGKLLEAISVSGWSDVPSYTPPAPSAPELDPLWTPGVPWADRGVDIDSEIRQMHQADPTLTLPRAMRLLYEKFPHIFEPPKEGTLSLNEALPSLPSTGVSETLMGHVGDTFSTEEEFRAKIAARKGQFSHA